MAPRRNRPARRIRFVIAATAGSSLDVIIRTLSDRFKDSLGQAIMIENRPAAGGTQDVIELASG